MNTSPSAVVVLSFLSLLLLNCSGDDLAKIVFVSNRDGNFEIYSMSADGSNQRQLTSSAANDISPSWSSDGKTILFCSDRTGNWEIYTMSDTGTNVSMLTKNAGQNSAPSWIPGENRILFVSTRDAVHGEIYSMNADGTGVQRVTHESSAKDTPVGTSGGSRLFLTVNDGVHMAIGEYSPSDRTIRLFTQQVHNAIDPRLSRDGTALLFASDQHGRMHVYTVSTSGGPATQLTSGDTDIRTPDWTSGTDQIVYSKSGGIILFSPSTKKEIRLSGQGDSSPCWFPR